MARELNVATKVDLYWVSFEDEDGIEHRRMAFKNPDGRIVLWDMGMDHPYGITHGGELPFEEKEGVSVDRIGDQSLARCPDWLEEQIIKNTAKNKKKFVREKGQKKPPVAEEIKRQAEMVAKRKKASVGDVGGALGEKV